MVLDPKLFRLIGWIAFALWCASLLSPISEISVYPYTGGNPDLIAMRNSQGHLMREHYGYMYLICGYLGIFQGCFAWFANLMFIAIMIVMVCRRMPYFWFTTLAFCLALTGLWPIRSLLTLDLDYAHDGLGIARGPAVYLWLASFAVLCAMTVYAKIRSIADIARMADG